MARWLRFVFSLGVLVGLVGLALPSQEAVAKAPSGALPSRDKMSREQLQYDAYALLIWNFIETIYDRCKEPNLIETWKPILDAEGDLHAKWFSLNLDKFKLDFRKWASRKIRGVSQFVDPSGHARSSPTS